MKNARKLLNFLDKNRKKISPLLILMHDHPDPDAIASAFALHHLCKNYFDIRSKIVYGGIISRIENRFMVDLLKIPLRRMTNNDFQRFPFLAIVDTQPEFGNNSFPKDRKATIVIDQHPSITRSSAELSIVDTKCAATCEILANALLLLKKNIPVNLATALVYGILTDTLNLSRVEDKSAIKTYLQLLPLCDMEKLIVLQNPPRTVDFFLMINRSLKNARLYDRLAVCHLGPIKDPVFVAHIADFLLSYKGIKWSFCTGRLDEKLLISMRTSHTKSVAYKILREILDDQSKAGGHGVIAGGSMTVGKRKRKLVWEKTERRLVHRLMKNLGVPVSKGKGFLYPFSS